LSVSYTVNLKNTARNVRS